MTELEALKARLAARERIPAFQSNCEALRARIAELEAGASKETDDDDQEA